MGSQPRAEPLAVHVALGCGTEIRAEPGGHGRAEGHGGGGEQSAPACKNAADSGDKSQREEPCWVRETVVRVVQSRWGLDFLTDGGRRWGEQICHPAFCMRWEKAAPGQACPHCILPKQRCRKEHSVSPAEDAPYWRLSYFHDTLTGLCLASGMHNPSSQPPLPCRGHLYLRGAGGPAACAAEGDGYSRPGEDRAAPVPQWHGTMLTRSSHPQDSPVNCERYLHWANAFLVVYSIDDRRSFEGCGRYLDILARHARGCQRQSPVLLLGNKLDMEQYRYPPPFFSQWEMTSLRMGQRACLEPIVAFGGMPWDSYGALTG